MFNFLLDIVQEWISGAYVNVVHSKGDRNVQDICHPPAAGAAAAAEEEVVDRNALLILDQQIRDAAGAVERGKRALAIAIVQDDAERKRSSRSRLVWLISRSGPWRPWRRVAKISPPKPPGPLPQWKMTAPLLQRRVASCADEIARLRSTVANFTRRLADLDRGRRTAMAAEAVRRLKAGHNPPGVIGTAALAEAEDTLRRLRERQTDDAAVDNVMQSLDPEAASATLIGPPRSRGLRPAHQDNGRRCARPAPQ